MSDAVTIECPPVLDIAAVQDFYQQLLPVFESATTLVLQCSALERIDTAGIQLLATCCMDAASRQKTVQWAGTSPALHDAARQLDLEKVLQLPESPTS